MRKYDPTIITCDVPTFYGDDKCEHTVATIPASEGIQRFEGTFYPFYLADDPKCFLAVGTRLKELFASWYSFWEVAVAVQGVCSRYGMVGTGKGFGGFSYPYISSLLLVWGMSGWANNEKGWMGAILSL